MRLLRYARNDESIINYQLTIINFLPTYPPK